MWVWLQAVASGIWHGAAAQAATDVHMGLARRQPPPTLVPVLALGTQSKPETKDRERVVARKPVLYCGSI